MGRIKSGANGNISGLVGNLVFVQGKGQTIVRTRQVRSKKSWSEKQNQHRQRFSEVAAFCQPFKRTVIQPIWNKIDPNRIGYNLFVKANMAAFALNGELADLSLLHFADGHLPTLSGCRVARKAGLEFQIEVSWNNDPLLGERLMADELWMMAATEAGIKGPFETGIPRKAGSATVVLPAEYGAATAVWLFWASADKESYSADKYCPLV